MITHSFSISLSFLDKWYVVYCSIRVNDLKFKLCLHSIYMLGLNFVVNNKSYNECSYRVQLTYIGSELVMNNIN